jgi:hypothetical protein
MLVLKFVGACICCLIVVLLAGGLSASYVTQDARPTGMPPALRQQLIHIDIDQAVRACGRQLGLRDDTRITQLDIALMGACTAPKIQEINHHYAR